VPSLRASLLVLLMLLSSVDDAHAWVSDPDLFAGDVLQFAPALAGAGIAWSRDDLEGARQLGYTVGSTFLLTHVVKHAANSTAWGERPNGSDYSFPSGHTSMACSGAAFLEERYGWHYGVPAYLLSAFIGYTRVDEDMHHWRDVVAGCGLAWGMGKLFTTRWQGRRLSLTPVADPHFVGLNLSYRW
jgi:membrane-associated phospholipid phosphatase